MSQCTEDAVGIKLTTLLVLHYVRHFCFYFSQHSANGVEETNKIIVTKVLQKNNISRSVGALNDQEHTALETFSLLLLKFSKCIPFPSLPCATAEESKIY